MPRRRADEQDETTLQQAVIRLTSGGHGPRQRDEHHIDEYQAPPGGSVALPRNVTPDSARPRNMAAEGRRYDDYIDALRRLDGDIIGALAEVFCIPVEQAAASRLDLLAQVRGGMGTSSIADLLERNDLTAAARVGVLRGHVYSGNPAASLKAIDMLQDMDGTKDAGENYDSYVRALMME